MICLRKATTMKMTSDHAEHGATQEPTVMMRNPWKQVLGAMLSRMTSSDKNSAISPRKHASLAKPARFRGDPRYFMVLQTGRESMAPAMFKMQPDSEAEPALYHFLYGRNLP